MGDITNRINSGIFRLTKRSAVTLENTEQRLWDIAAGTKKL
jgi:hypothetical protein